MEHKSFLFDTKGFELELCDTVIASGENDELRLLKQYIVNNIGKIRSPYTGEFLDDDWEDELELGNVQELADFALTKFYSPEEEFGLSYSWDSLLEALKQLLTTINPEYWVLGYPVESEKFRLDPGGMGTGIVRVEDVPIIFRNLIELRSQFIESEFSEMDNSLYEHTFQELIDAYDELTQLYKEANDNKKGLLMTF